MYHSINRKYSISHEADSFDSDASSTDLDNEVDVIKMFY